MRPRVSICCITYNHAPYIAQCIEGFLMQKTNFTYEILIHDDASTDGTQEIVLEYAKKYPDIIKPHFQSENQYSKGNGFIGLEINIKKSEGDYIAFCEGDDYWTDPYKLQNQFDCLEKHPDISLCHHNYRILKNGEESLRNTRIPTTQTITEVAFFNTVQTATMFFRKPQDPIVDKTFKFQFPVYQFFWTLRILEYGNLMYIDKPMSTYRVHPTGIYSSKNRKQQFVMSMGNLHNMIAWYTKKGRTDVVLSLKRRAAYNFKESVRGTIRIKDFKTTLFMLIWYLKYIK